MSKEEKAKKLYSAVGEADDSFIQEAADYERASRAKKNRRNFLKAAVLLLGVVLVLSGIGRSLSHGIVPGDPTDAEALLCDRMEAAAHPEPVPVDPVSLDRTTVLGGENAIYWSLDGGETVYKVGFSDARMAEYLQTLSDVRETPSDTTLLLWIGDREGNVATPYLRQSDGNVAFGHLFSYTPEVTPGDRCLTFLAELLAQLT